MKILKTLIFISILFSLGLFIRATDMSKVISSLQLLRYNFITLIITTFIAYFLAAIGWRFCMGSQGKHFPLGILFIIRHIGETISLVNPASFAGGEAMKILLLSNRGIERKTIITSVLFSRLIMMLSQILLFLSAAAFLLVNEDTQFTFKLPSLPILFYILPAVFFLLIVVIWSNNKVKTIYTKIKIFSTIKERTNIFRKKIKELVAQLPVFFRNNNRDLALAFLFFSLHWVLGSLEFYLILKFLGMKASVVQALLADMGVILFKSAGAFVPAQIGVEEYGNKVMLAAIGIPDTEIWVSASILRRARQLFWIAFGLGIYFIINKKSNNLVHQH